MEGFFDHTFIVQQDSFYKYHTEEEMALAHANRFDFDHPDALDMPMFAAVRSLESPTRGDIRG